MPCRLATALLLALWPLAAMSQTGGDSPLGDGSAPAVLAHRSAEMGGAPENSLAWIRYAIERGVDIVHINPQLTADGRYVLMHDNTLNRTTDVETVFPEGPPNGPTRTARGGLDYVRDYTLDQIRQLHLTGTDGAPVPALDEALDLAKGRLRVLLGLKSYEIDSLAATLAGRDTDTLLLSDLYVSGTDQRKLRDLADTTGIGVAIVLYRSTDYLADLEAIAAQLGPTLRMVWVTSPGLTDAFTAALRERGLGLIIGGWSGPEDSALLYKDDPAPWQAMLARGVIAATDQPDRVLSVLGR